jgi:hypothetical protein
MTDTMLHMSPPCRVVTATCLRCRRFLTTFIEDVTPSHVSRHSLSALQVRSRILPSIKFLLQHHRHRPSATTAHLLALQPASPRRTFPWLPIKPGRTIGSSAPTPRIHIHAPPHHRSQPNLLPSTQFDASNCSNAAADTLIHPRPQVVHPMIFIGLNSWLVCCYFV